MNKLLGQRKQFNLAAAPTSGWLSSSDDESSPSAVPVLSQFNATQVAQCIAECTTDSCTSSDEYQVIDRYADTSDALDTSIYHRRVPKVRKQRTTSQRSNKSTKSGGSVASVTRTVSDYLNDTSDDEAFMNNSANFEQSPSRSQRRTLRKKKSSSLKRRAGVQRVPETPVPVVVDHPQQPMIGQPELRDVISALDTTLDMSGDLSLQWIENDDAVSKSGDSGCHVISEKSLLVANAETEDALSDYSDNPAGVFKMPYPVAYRPNLCKRKLVEESDEEYITSHFRGPIKRNCIRYYY